LISRTDGSITIRNVVTDQLVLEGYDLVKSCWERYGACSYIVDYSQATEILLSAEAVRRLARKKPILHPQCFQVNVAPQSEMHKLARMYQIVSTRTRPTFQVVRTMEEALNLIGVASATFTPIEEDFRKAA
jgi:hypothetical protein